MGVFTKAYLLHPYIEHGPEYGLSWFCASGKRPASEPVNDFKTPRGCSLLGLTRFRGRLTRPNFGAAVAHGIKEAAGPAHTA